MYIRLPPRTLHSTKDMLPCESTHPSNVFSKNHSLVYLGYQVTVNHAASASSILSIHMRSKLIGSICFYICLQCKGGISLATMLNIGYTCAGHT